MVDRHEHKAFNDPDRPKSGNSDRIVSRPHDRLSAIEKVSGGRYPLNAGWVDLRRHRRTSVVFKTTFVRQVGTLLVHLLATVEAHRRLLRQGCR